MNTCTKNDFAKQLRCLLESAALQPSLVAPLPTPIQRLERLEKKIGNKVEIYVKRDDLLGMGGGGNKLRKLDFLIKQALDKKAKHVIAVGGVQSNFCRLMAAAAAAHGLKCHLVLARAVKEHDPEYDHTGNVLLNHLFGAHLYYVDSLEKANEKAQALHDKLGEKEAFLVGLGGSTVFGILGYAACALEIGEQEKQIGQFKRIITPNGSFGTQAGLLLGQQALDHRPEIRGYSVLKPANEARTATVKLLNDTLTEHKLNHPPFKPEDVLVDGSQLGEGYGRVTPQMIQAVRLLARTEGLLLDPVYSGKAFAGLLQDINELPPGSKLLFLMTGGTPGLYAYGTSLMRELPPD